VLLLQEVYRRASDVPATLPTGSHAAGFMRHAPAGIDRDIVDTARALGLDVLYVPSMRNGSQVQEDRGNAILSTLPLEDDTAIELPFERQRRVAVAATVRVPATDGRSPAVRVASVHLTNMVGHHGWLLSEVARVRQARAFAATIGDDPIVVGGDLNAWFGGLDGAYRELARRVPPGATADARPTFLFMRLDHFFSRPPARWGFGFHRAERRYGSDHYPLIGELRPAP
jgi:endonuclease/exonuclease/phosphatase family metal-dependent hydrolase